MITIRKLLGGEGPARDPSAWSLLAANLITIAVAIWERWDLAPLMWIYWGQSCIIGWFNFARMMSLRRFSTEGLKMNDRPVAPTRRGQLQTSFFFLFHYGFFHVGYLVFLRIERPLPEGVALPVVVCVAIFAVNHFISFRHHLEGDRRQKRNLGTIMFFPYARIIPMHLTIIVGGQVAGAPSALLLFLALKTLADLIMHAVEHRQRRDPRLAPAEPEP